MSSLKIQNTNTNTNTNRTPQPRNTYPGTLSQHILSAHGDDCAQTEDEVVHVGGVEVVGGHSVGHTVAGHVVGPLGGVAQHVFGVHFHGVVAQFVFGDGFQALRYGMVSKYGEHSLLCKNVYIDDSNEGHMTTI